MRWNCPHCGVNLAISDEKLGPGWSFSRCYKCGGFALIRKAEVNLIKVDRAPAGENVLLPEASDQPLSMLSEGAMQNLARIRKSSTEKLIPRDIPVSASTPAQTSENPAPVFPQTLPELREAGSSSQRKVLAGAISLAAIATVGSGIYLYIQGQALWEKARTPHNSIEAMAYRASEVVPAPSLASRANRNGRVERAEVSDQVHDRAMAPLRTPSNDSDPSAQPRISAFMVTPNSENVEFRSGPGPSFQKIGTANARQRYVVTDWSNQWFKVAITDSKNAWIRSDAVQVVPAEPRAADQSKVANPSSNQSQGTAGVSR